MRCLLLSSNLLHVSASAVEGKKASDQQGDKLYLNLVVLHNVVVICIDNVQSLNVNPRLLLRHSLQQYSSLHAAPGNVQRTAAVPLAW